MNTNSIDLSHIRRPKLIMAAAKELVIRRKRLTNSKKSLNQSRITEIMSREMELEGFRKEKSVNYSVDMHIRCLADMIEYSRDTQPRLAVV